MRVCMKTMFRIVRWALSSMPSMPWPTASMICTRKCARDSQGSVGPWTLSMVASCWITCSRHPSEESQGRIFILIKMETPQEGKKRGRTKAFRMYKKAGKWKWKILYHQPGYNLWISFLSHSSACVHMHTCVHKSWTQRDVISLDWNRFSWLSAVAATFISLQSNRQHLTVRKHSRVIPSSVRG